MNSHPPKLAFDLERDVRTLSAMASSLTPYLYEAEVFGHLDSDMPRLTLGGLLLRLHRLTSIENLLDVDQQNLVHDARLNFEAERAKWAVHYENKILQELRARLTALEQFLHECGEKRAGCAADYPVQAEKRTMIHHLAHEAARLNILPDDLAAHLKLLDQKLRQLLTEDGSEFVTDERLSVAYPRSTYWWMYSYISE